MNSSFKKQRPLFQIPIENEKIKSKISIASCGMKLQLQKKFGIFFGELKDDEDPRIYSIKDRPLFYVGKPQSVDGHCAIFGSSGSGKGSCVAVPTMVSWGSSPMVVLDPKGDLSELYMRMTSTEKRPVKIFNPAKDDTCTYDPFSHIRNDDKSNQVANVRELVNAIIPSPLDSRDRFWITAAQKILTGALLYYLDLSDDTDNSDSEMDFYTAIDCITSTPLEKLFKKIDRSGNAVAKKYIRSFSAKDDLSDSEMLMDINETLDTYLMNFINDMRLQKALTPSDNSINWETDLDEYNIFLSIPEDRIEQWGSLLNVMVTQLIRTLERRPERYSPQGGQLKPVLLLLDEFPMIGRIDVLASALSMLRSKNVTILLIAQSISQLSGIYGQDTRNIMLENCDFQAVLRVNCADSQKYFSELAGSIPELSWTISDNYQSEDSKVQWTSHSESASIIDQPFIRPEELAHLDKDMILFTPYGTFRIKKSPFFDWKSEIFAPLPDPQDEEETVQTEQSTDKKIPPDARKSGGYTFRNFPQE